MGRYFDRAWLIYNRAETGVYADLASTRKRGGSTSWHGTLIGPVNWAKFLQESRGTRAALSRRRDRQAVRLRPSGVGRPGRGHGHRSAPILNG